MKTLIDEKNDEMDRLELVKQRIEHGGEISLSEVDAPESWGLRGRLEELARDEAELDALRKRLEETRQKQRYKKALRTEGDREETLEDTSEDPLGIGAGKDESSHNGDGSAEGSVGPEASSPVDLGGVEAGAEAASDVKRGLPLGVDVVGLADAYFRKGDYTRALEAYRLVDHPAKDGDRILFMIARCRERLGDACRGRGDETAAAARYAAAEGDYREVAKVYPGTFWADETAFALSVLSWKTDLGPIQGSPREAVSILETRRLARALKDASAGTDAGTTKNGTTGTRSERIDAP